MKIGTPLTKSFDQKESSPRYLKSKALKYKKSRSSKNILVQNILGKKEENTCITFLSIPQFIHEVWDLRVKGSIKKGNEIKMEGMRMFADVFEDFRAEIQIQIE